MCSEKVHLCGFYFHFVIINLHIMIPISMYNPANITHISMIHNSVIIDISRCSLRIGIKTYFLHLWRKERNIHYFVTSVLLFRYWNHNMLLFASLTWNKNDACRSWRQLDFEIWISNTIFVLSLWMIFHTIFHVFI